MRDTHCVSPNPVCEDTNSYDLLLNIRQNTDPIAIPCSYTPPHAGIQILDLGHFPCEPNYPETPACEA